MAEQQHVVPNPWRVPRVGELPGSGVARLPVTGTQPVARRRLSPKASWMNAARGRRMRKNRNLLILKGGTGAMLGEMSEVRQQNLWWAQGASGWRFWRGRDGHRTGARTGAEGMRRPGFSTGLRGENVMGGCKILCFLLTEAWLRLVGGRGLSAGNGSAGCGNSKQQTG